MCGQKFLYSKTNTHARVIQLRCRSWTCNQCRPRRQKRLKWQALSGNPVTFITLTCNPHIHSHPGIAARAMSKAWRAARRQIENHYKGKRAEYLTVVEATKNGWPHFHILTTRRWIDQKWLSQLWNDLTGAPIVHIERVKNIRHAASYVAKYIGKAPHRFLKMKRYYFTRGYLPKKAPASDPFDWSTATHSEQYGCANYFAAVLLASGYDQLTGREGYYIFSLEHPPPCVQPCLPVAA